MEQYHWMGWHQWIADEPAKRKCGTMNITDISGTKHNYHVIDYKPVNMCALIELYYPENEEFHDLQPEQFDVETLRNFKKKCINKDPDEENAIEFWVALNQYFWWRMTEVMTRYQAYGALYGLIEAKSDYRVC